jgi:hypothetical protein
MVSEQALEIVLADGEEHASRALAAPSIKRAPHRRRVGEQPNQRTRAYTPILITTPESIAETWLGALACAREARNGAASRPPSSRSRRERAGT